MVDYGPFEYTKDEIAKLADYLRNCARQGKIVHAAPTLTPFLSVLGAPVRSQNNSPHWDRNSSDSIPRLEMPASGTRCVGRCSPRSSVR